MRGTGSSKSRRRLIKLAAPAIVVLYILMIPLNSVIETEHSEVFPFFKWKLFAHIPDWETYEYALIVDAIDGHTVEGEHYLIPSDTVRDRKALRQAALACRDGTDCDDTVVDVIYPIVRRELNDSIVDFRIVRAQIDLRDMQDHVSGLTEGETAVTDLFRPVEVLGRWNTETGRTPQSAGIE